MQADGGMMTSPPLRRQAFHTVQSWQQLGGGRGERMGAGPQVSLHLSHWGPGTGRQHHSEAPPADSLSAAAPEPGSVLCPGPAGGPPGVVAGRVSKANPDAGTAPACPRTPHPTQVWDSPFQPVAPAPPSPGCPQPWGPGSPACLPSHLQTRQGE